MFHDIPAKMKERMEFLEEADAKDRIDGTDRMKRLRQIPPETGKFIALLAAGAPGGNFVEVGTSAGYSTLWLSLVMKERGIKIDTLELLPEKIALAKETFSLSGVNDYVNLVEGDARDYLSSAGNIAFCFLDAEKEIYEECYELVKDKFVPGGILAADNAINHYDKVKPMIDKVENNPDFDSLVVPIGMGVLVARYLPGG